MIEYPGIKFNVGKMKVVYKKWPINAIVGKTQPDEIPVSKARYDHETAGLKTMIHNFIQKNISCLGPSYSR